MPKASDLTGQTFGLLTVIEKTEQRYRGNVVWRCSCKCRPGRETMVPSMHLTQGLTQSCGCLALSNTGATHAIRKQRLFRNLVQNEAAEKK